MNKLTALLVAAGVLSGTFLYAQGRQNRSRTRTSRQMNEETAKQWSSVQAELKKKYPEKFAKIESLAKTNIPAAMQEMNNLAREANIETPSPFRNRGQRDGMGPGGFGDGRNQRFGGMRPGMGGGFMNINARSDAEKQLKEKYPQEYAKIDKQRDDAEAKLQALAKKAGITLPDTMETRRKKMEAVRIKYKAEFDEIDKLRESDPMTAMERTREIYQREGLDFMGGRQGGSFQNSSRNEPPAPPRRGNPMMEKMTQLQKAYPEEMKKLQAIREEDPAAYRKGIQELAARYKKEYTKGK